MLNYDDGAIKAGTFYFAQKSNFSRSGDRAKFHIDADGTGADNSRSWDQPGKFRSVELPEGDLFHEIWRK